MPAALALPDIGLVIAGVFLLILAYALFLLRDFLVGSLSHLPVVGGWVGRTLAGWIDAARAAVISAAGSVFSGAERLFRTSTAWMENVLYKISYTATAVVTTVVHIATVQIPRIYGESRAWATHQALSVYHDAVGWYHDALARIDAARAWAVTVGTSVLHESEAYAAARASAAVAYAAALFTAAEHDTAAAAAAARAFAAAEVAQLARAAAAEISTAEDIAVSLFRTAEADTAAALGAAEAYAAARAAAAEQAAWAAVQGAASAGLAAAWPGIITDVDSLRGVIADSWPDIRDAVDAIPRAVPADLAGGLAALGVLAIPMLRAMEDCVLPNCRNLGGLGSFLHDLLGAAEAAALLAWVTYCIADPVAAADDTEAVGGPVASGTLGGLERLFGVAV